MGRKINLNTAGKAELDRIEEGIGAYCASAILEFRDRNGGHIDSIEDLGKLPGFGEKALEHLRRQAEV